LFLSRKFELIVPVFFGCLGSLVISASLMMQNYTGEDQELSHEAVLENHSKEMGNIYFFAPDSRPERQDRILALYRNTQTQSGVFDFFTEICDSAEIAEVILYNANLFDIPPALAIALAWEESRFNPGAVNNKNQNESIDRGLFQLNDRSFPRLEIQAFFNPETNAWYAMNHLRHCLDTGGTEIAALAMYNAGTNRVRGAGTPKVTLDYISRILENRWEIEDRFRNWEARYHEQQLEEIENFAELAEIKPERARLVPLMPLSGK
jgi:hypothetical protein